MLSINAKCLNINLLLSLFLKSRSISFPVAEKGSIHSQVDLLTPATAEAGSTVTLTLSVHALDSLDSNYAVAYLSVVPPVRSCRSLGAPPEL